MPNELPLTLQVFYGMSNCGYTEKKNPPDQAASTCLLYGVSLSPIRTLYPLQVTKRSLWKSSPSPKWSAGSTPHGIRHSSRFLFRLTERCSTPLHTWFPSDMCDGSRLCSRWPRPLRTPSATTELLTSRLRLPGEIPGRDRDQRSCRFGRRLGEGIPFSSTTYIDAFLPGHPGVRAVPDRGQTGR